MHIILPLDAKTYLDRLNKRLEDRSPDPFRPADLAHGPSQDFLLEEGIWSLWCQDAAVLTALEIFSHPNAREHVNALLSSGFNYNQVASVLTTQLGLACTDAAVEEYEHYFWNMLMLTVDERSRIHNDAKAGSVVMEAYLGGKNASTRVQIINRLGYNVTGHELAEAESYLNKVFAEANKVESRPPNVRAMEMSSYAGSIKSMCEVVERLRLSGGESINMAAKLQEVRSKINVADGALLGTPNFQPARLGRRSRKALPAEGVLSVRDEAVEETTDENRSRPDSSEEVR
jgi:hypothetical protein